MPKGDPCQRQACDIQKCLQAHKYKESSCKEVFQAMERCCEKFQGRSGCCSGFEKERQRKKLPVTALR